MKTPPNKYQVCFQKTGKAVLRGEVRNELNKRILDLENNPRPSGCKKLTNRPSYRIRYADYRIRYIIEDNILTVTVIDTGHRRDIYE